jgi:signal transduction histidine kinase
VTVPPISEERKHGTVPAAAVSRLLDTIDKPLLVTERSGTVMFANAKARHFLNGHALKDVDRLNLFSDFLRVDSRKIFTQIEKGDHQVTVQLDPRAADKVARIRWMPEPDWLVVEIEEIAQTHSGSQPATQLTVQELLQEREITYRNLLAAYLKLQEVNRQKTVFLASAAHELKTPLAVIKGYYDLLLAGSLGRLTDKQKDILEESKDSCERLVRLVSMFLNYSALESGKLVLQLRENDLRDCLEELAKRWSEAFQRKGVKLDAKFDPSIPTFRFDYQKVQQAAATGGAAFLGAPCGNDGAG